MAKKKTQEKKNYDNPNVVGLRAEVLEQPITETLETNYMPYAMSVIVSRAIPEIDGFKPSHRKLLYTRFKMGLLTGGRTKSANIVGQTMKLNPHGDAAIYETMVRLSAGYQALLMPFVDSKGNFGKVYSRDMSYAASRYTEAKLSAICGEVFRDIDKDTVDFVDNYDGSMKEPCLLPTAFPNVLVSANMGIAVGMASQICGFNLGEVCETTINYLRDPEHDLLSTMPAPDFPTGGEIVYDRAAMENIYRTGRGSFKVRSRWRYLPKENIIEIYEIPYTTTSEAIIDKVAELIKAGKAKEIADMRDETDLSGLKLTIDLKRGQDPDKLMQKLYRSTPMEDSFACNFNVLVGGQPRVMGVREILKEWVAFRTDCVRRRTYFELQGKQKRLHLLKGLEAILLDIDKAIRIVRETEEDAEVVPNLMIGFGIDETQAEYVAEIKLRHLNREYILKRTTEIEDLEREIARLQEVLESKSKMRRIIVDELNDVAKKYGQPRRSEIVYDYAEENEGEGEPAMASYPVTLFFTREGYFKKITPQSLRMSGEQKLKEGDEITQRIEAKNDDWLLFFTNQQQVYKCRAGDFEDTKASVMGDFVPSRLGFDEGETPLYLAVTSGYEGHMLFFFESGKCARVPMESYATKQNRKKLLKAYSAKEPLAALLYLPQESELAIRTSGSRLLLVGSAQIAEKATRDSQGVAVITLKRSQHITWVGPAEQLELTAPHRYRVRTLPAAGALIRGEDTAEQLTLG